MMMTLSTKRRASAAFSFFRVVPLAASVCTVTVAASTAYSQRPSTTPPAVAGFFDVVRPAYSGDRALATVAFVEQRWRWPGNRGFEESIDHVAEQLRGAGYVEEKTAKPGD